jgi:hypothetical protein
MTRLGCWIVGHLTRLLDEDEREVVRGDLAECHTPTGRALREVLGLVVRRQLEPWCSWRPWFVLATIVIPIGLLLSYAARSWGVTAAHDVSIYWRFWDFSYLAVPGWRRDVIDVAVRIGSGCLALVGWSWTCGFVLGRLSRRTVWLTLLMFAAVVFFGTLGTVVAGQPSENPSLRYHVVFVVLPRVFRTFLVVLPLAWGAYRGSRASSLPLGLTLLGVAVLAGATFLVSQGLERSLVFGGLVRPDPGPDGFLVSADDPRPLWFLSLVMMWPAAYVLTAARPQSQSASGGASSDVRSRWR